MALKKFEPQTYEFTLKCSGRVVTMRALSMREQAASDSLATKPGEVGYLRAMSSIVSLNGEALPYMQTAKDLWNGMDYFSGAEADELAVKFAEKTGTISDDSLKNE